MIFNKYLTEQQIVEKLIRESEFENGIILRAYYNEESDLLAVGELYYILAEKAPSIHSKELYIANNDADRKIIVGESEKGGHSARLKVFGRGSSQLNSISFKYDNGKLEIVGDPKDIGMNKKELNKYKEFVEKHKNLIMLTPNSDLEDIHNALKNDAKLDYDYAKYNDNKKNDDIKEYERTVEGNLIRYTKDKKSGKIKTKSIEDLKGRKIKS